MEEISDIIAGPLIDTIKTVVKEMIKEGEIYVDDGELVYTIYD